MGTGHVWRKPSKKYFTNGKFMTLFLSSAGGQEEKKGGDVCDSKKKVDSIVYDEMSLKKILTQRQQQSNSLECLKPLLRQKSTREEMRSEGSWDQTMWGLVSMGRQL